MREVSELCLLLLKILILKLLSKKLLQNVNKVIGNDYMLAV